jgi:hypothetical protein
MEITDLNFADIIEQKTGKVLGVDYGFIAGTFLPFNINSKGLASAINTEGYRIWKKENKGLYEYLNVNKQTHVEETVQIVIDF